MWWLFRKTSPNSFTFSYVRKVKLVSRRMGNYLLMFKPMFSQQRTRMKVC
ncbi:hypothetical protein M8C21_017900 [Ambrosia artemisiifolia]|uniref:Uncharacterized protein n=1 Tax=Ambrosia artemisiifolia TaxID=4212 RepID=A0AAD5CBB2_AMBAR|nr:hypothetical protein M8C21_017900 [Ambrosia artemisiifolia]